MVTSNRFDLSDKVVIVTGGAGLLGVQHVEALAEAGANVVVADIKAEMCKEIAVEVGRRYGVPALGVPTDVTDHLSIEAMVSRTVSEFGKVDALINNAALNDKSAAMAYDDYFAPFEDYPLHLWEMVIKVNLTSAFLCSQVVGKQMVKQQGGAIVNISSIYGINAPDQRLYARSVGPSGRQNYKPASYSVTKGALISLTRYLAAYWAKDNIRVNTLTLGGVFDGQDEEFVRMYEAKTPLGVMADKGDYKGAIVFLVADASSYMTGANLVVDGGWSVW